MSHKRTSSSTRASPGWTAGVRVSIDQAGHLLLGKGRRELLENIDRHHSISAAARAMGMSYRRAWELVQAMNAAAGRPLVEAATGGRGGGGARLTPHGRWILAVYQELNARLERTAMATLAQLLGPPGATTLHVAAAVSLEEVLEQLLTDYTELQPHVRVRAVFGASDELVEHLLAGAPIDVFLSADDGQLDRVEAAGLALAGPRVVLAENGLAAVGPAGRPPVVRRPADLRRGKLGRVVLAEPGCPLGRYTRAYLDSLRAGQAAEGAVCVDSSRAVLTAVQAGQADLGLVYSSDTTHAPGCRVLFRAERLPTPIRYSGAVVAGGGDREPAQALLDFLTSAAAGRRFRAAGFHVP